MSKSTKHLMDEHLQEYLDGELSPEGRSKVEAHLGACEDCSARMETWRALFVEIDELPDVALIPDFEPIVLTRLDKRFTAQNQMRWLIPLQGILAVSILVYGWERISTTVPIGQVGDWLALPYRTLQTMVDAIVLGIADAFDGFLASAFSTGDLVVHLPQISSNGTLLTYAVLLVILLWVIGNHYLLRVPGRVEDTHP